MLGAVSVATAVLLPGTPAASVAVPVEEGAPIVVEHPTGTFDASIDIDRSGQSLIMRRAGIIRTARKLMDGIVFGRS